MVAGLACWRAGAPVHCVCVPRPPPSKPTPATGRYFSLYHSILCGLRVSGTIKTTDFTTSAFAGGVALLPFFRQRKHFLTFGTLVAFDNVGRVMEMLK